MKTCLFVLLSFLAFFPSFMVSFSSNLANLALSNIGQLSAQSDLKHRRNFKNGLFGPQCAICPFWGSNLGESDRNNTFLKGILSPQIL